MTSRIARGAAALIAAVLFCILLQAAAPLIDTPAMRANAAQGVAMLREQQAVPQMVGGFKSSQLDNYTAVLLVKTAAYTGTESYLHRVFGGLRTDMPAQEGESAWDAYCTYADGALSPTGGLSYSRYWHGYTLPLRLLLCAFNLSNIQMLLYYVQLAMMAAIVALMLRRGLRAAVPAFFTAYFLMMPFVMGVCLQYMTASVPMLAACIAVLTRDESISRAVGMPVFFAVVGVVTSFLDLLTFPLVTLGFPLTLLLALRLKAGDSFARLLALALACCVGWGFGFGSMWALKWIICGACFGWEMLRSVFAQVFLRVSSESGGVAYSRLDALKMNFSMLFSKSSFLLLMLASAVASLLPAASRLLRSRALKADLRASVLLVPAALPFAWFFVMANHSIDHAYYTCRSAAIFVFAALALVCFLFDQRSA